MSIKKDKYYSVSAEVARLSGVVSARYRTKDKRFILSDRDLKKAIYRMTPEEFIGGVDAIPISENEANILIAKNRYQMGEEYVTDGIEEQPAQVAEEEQPEGNDSTEETDAVAEEADESSEETTEESKEEATSNETEE